MKIEVIVSKTKLDGTTVTIKFENATLTDLYTITNMLNNITIKE